MESRQFTVKERLFGQFDGDTFFLHFRNTPDIWVQIRAKTCNVTLAEMSEMVELERRYTQYVNRLQKTLRRVEDDAGNSYDVVTPPADMGNGIVAGTLLDDSKFLTAQDMCILRTVCDMRYCTVMDIRRVLDTQARQNSHLAVSKNENDREKIIRRKVGKLYKANILSIGYIMQLDKDGKPKDGAALTFCMPTLTAYDICNAAFRRTVRPVALFPSRTPQCEVLSCLRVSLVCGRIVQDYGVSEGGSGFFAFDTPEFESKWDPELRRYNRGRDTKMDAVMLFRDTNKELFYVAVESISATGDEMTYTEADLEIQMEHEVRKVFAFHAYAEDKRRRACIILVIESLDAMTRFMAKVKELGLREDFVEISSARGIILTTELANRRKEARGDKAFAVLNTDIRDGKRRTFYEPAGTDFLKLKAERRDE